MPTHAENPLVCPGCDGYGTDIDDMTCDACNGIGHAPGAISFTLPYIGWNVTSGPMNPVIRMVADHLRTEGHGDATVSDPANNCRAYVSFDDETRKVVISFY